MSELYRYDPDRGGPAAVKVRPDSPARISRCLLLQLAAARNGFPCPAPLTGAGTLAGGLVVSAEEWRPGGGMLPGDDPPAAARSAGLLAELMAVLAGESGADLHPAPPWMGWNPPGGRLWPADDRIDSMDQRRVPVAVHAIARRAAARLRRGALPSVVGHGDWEAQNMSWQGARARAVYDWDSLVFLPEAAIVGAASGAFASARIPTLAPVGSSEEFISAYEAARGRTFSRGEREVAWAASLWPALHNARGEHLFRAAPVASAALMAQAAERLRRANA
jgi:hypothetical protein